MAIIQLSGTPGAAIWDYPQYRVQVRRFWSAAWETIDYLEPITVTQAIAPTVPQASFVYRYGEIKREDAAAFAVYTPLAIVNYYVRIDALANGFEQLLFVGILMDDEYDMRAAVTNPSGDQVITAYGLEHLLDRKAVYGAYVEGGAYISRTPTFNGREQWGGQLTGNRSSAAAWEAVFSRDGEKWSHLDIICYALTYFAPDGFNVGLSGAWEVLSNLYGVYEFEGLTLRQILDKLIDSRRGFGWHVWTDGFDVTVYIFTVFDQAFAVNGITYPANPEIYTQAFDAYPEIAAAGVSISQAQLYDKIVVQGARVKSCFTVSVRSNTLEPAWSSAEAAEYDSADDVERGTDKYKAVYQRFKLPTDWDWRDRGGRAVALAFDDQAVITDQAAPHWNSARPLLRWLPILRTDGGDGQHYLPPMALIKGAVGDGDEQYYQVDKLDLVSREPAALRMLDNELGIELHSQHNHVFGLGSFNGVSTVSADWDYAELLATVAVETDVRPTVVIQIGGETDVDRTLVLTLWDADYWYVAPNTVLGVDNGALFYHPGGAVRDETEKLRSIAALAAAWYGKYRGVMRLTLSDVRTDWMPGAMIDSVSSAWQWLPVSSIISSVTWDLRAGKTTINTGFSELDFVTLLDVPGMSDFRSVGRAFNRQQAEIKQLRQHMGSLPVRDVVGGSSVAQSGDNAINADFFVDCFDRADAGNLGVMWSGSEAFAIIGGRCYSNSGAIAAAVRKQAGWEIVKARNQLLRNPNLEVEIENYRRYYLDAYAGTAIGTDSAKSLAAISSSNFNVKLYFSLDRPLITEYSMSDLSTGPQMQSFEHVISCSYWTGSVRFGSADLTADFIFRFTPFLCDEFNFNFSETHQAISNWSWESGAGDYLVTDIFSPYFNGYIDRAIHNGEFVAVAVPSIVPNSQLVGVTLPYFLSHSSTAMASLSASLNIPAANGCLLDINYGGADLFSNAAIGNRSLSAANQQDGERGFLYKFIGAGDVTRIYGYRYGPGGDTDLKAISRVSISLYDTYSELAGPGNYLVEGENYVLFEHVDNKVTCYVNDHLIGQYDTVIDKCGRLTLEAFGNFAALQLANQLDINNYYTKIKAWPMGAPEPVDETGYGRYVDDALDDSGSSIEPYYSYRDKYHTNIAADGDVPEYEYNPLA
jgi:hypothetical protein